MAATAVSSPAEYFYTLVSSTLTAGIVKKNDENSLHLEEQML